MDKHPAGSGRKGGVRRRPAADASVTAHIGQVIRRYRLDARLGQADLAEQLGVTKTAVGNWELGLTRPDIGTLPRLCEALDLPVTELLGMKAEAALPRQDRAFLDTFRLLDRYDRTTVLELMQRLQFRQDAQEKRRLRSLYRPLCLYEEAAAAGVGSPMQDRAENKTLFLLSDRVPHGTDGVIHVNGRSMEPDYPNGSFVYVDTSVRVLPGQVGIFIVNGESFIKQFQPDGLYSLNPRYRPIRFDDGTEIRVFGRVTGLVGAQDIAPDPLAEKIQAAFDDLNE